MKNLKLTTALFALLFAAGLFTTASAQLQHKNVEHKLGAKAQANPDKVTAEFDIYQQGWTVHVVDLSSGPVQSRHWDMDDGGIKTNWVLFSHPYKEPGLYKICLTVTGPTSSDKQCHKVIIK